MKKYLKYVIAILFLFSLCGCSEKYTLNYVASDDGEKTIYEIENKKYVETEEKTNLVKIEVEDFGIMIAELYPEIAPITVENFKKLVDEKFYDGLIFHRVLKNLIIQTGDPLGIGTGGSSEEIKGEFVLNGVENDLSHTRGVLSMARRGSEPETEETMNSASSQFFIMVSDYTGFDGSYAAFGKVIAGLDVVDKVGSVTTNSYDKPLNDQVMKSIRFVNEYVEE